MFRHLADWYENGILGRPHIVLLAVFALVFIVGWHAKDFELDASAESLTLEHDEALRYYRQIRDRYGSDDFLVITYRPDAPLFGESSLDGLAHLRNELSLVANVRSVTSILDVPLLQSPPVGIEALQEDIPRLANPVTDRALARKELLQSPLYRELMISEDGQTTAIQVVFADDAEYLSLRDQRNALREAGYYRNLTRDESRELASLEMRFQKANARVIAQERQQIAAVRDVLARHRDLATMHLGGVPMIIADSMDFIRHDLVVFGVAVILFLITILSIAFRQARWVLLPLVTCLSTCIIMLGVLGLFGWRVTVVSSNFLSLSLILCLALTLHIIVRYREVQLENQQASQRQLVSETVRHIVVPCAYTALTTMVAFGSLVVSGIRPVIDFGWMMVIAIGVAFLLSFLLFPASLMLLGPSRGRTRRDFTARITAFFYHLIDQHRAATLVTFFLCAIASVAGITRLTVENRFIDYYHHTTDIYRGMVVIDRQLGGTTPLDVIIDAPAGEDGATGRDAEFEDIFAEAGPEAGLAASSYWYNRWRLDRVESMHDYLDALPESGKVVSLATTIRLLRQVDPALLRDNLQLSLVHRKLPETMKETLFAPYLSPNGDQLRFSIRVFESDPSLRRAQLIERIPRELGEQFDLDADQVHLSGMLVLYNNLLQSLYRSQILTLGAVFGAITIMFLVLFRSLRVAIIGIIPNVLSAMMVLGLMGWARIPLDVMTITIAAITIGIGVDDTIHYIHRFETEFARDGDYWAAIRRCHATIGRAMYYTSVTIMLGFSILMLSSFVPTIYFGVLTGIAMMIALLADLTLLPVLLAVLKGGIRKRRAVGR
jgi:predicted RND superfamily exporter protein